MANIRTRKPIPPHHRPDSNLRPQDDSETAALLGHRKARSADRGPWNHMADTYAWVERHYAALDSRGKKTEKWVLDQQIFYSHSTPGPRNGSTLINDHELQVDGRKRDEENFRRFAGQTREKEKARIIREELERIEGRIRQRRETEKQRVAAERSRFLAEIKQRERDARVKTDQAIRYAWRRYENGWEGLLTTSVRLTFSIIPWPLPSKPKKAEDIRATEIRDFILSPLHSERQTAKERIRRAQLRWHPDRFRRILTKIEPKDKTAIEVGAGIVARCLNDIMAQQA
ncbi:hypothetical protein B0H11DRAFT_1735545 [Mycena galericulata]|nr:hypothetical protein B0H11DRAFT_1735545 [Mycena galericulata]